jgi:hypothetical protein
VSGLLLSTCSSPQFGQWKPFLRSRGQFTIPRSLGKSQSIRDLGNPVKPAKSRKAGLFQQTRLENPDHFSLFSPATFAPAKLLKIPLVDR